MLCVHVIARHVCEGACRSQERALKTLELS